MKTILPRSASAFFLFVGLSIGFSFASRAEDNASGWQVYATPYVWLPNIEGSLNFSTVPGTGGTTHVELGPSDYLSQLNFGFMTLVEARNDDWSVFTDFIFIKASGETAHVASVTAPGGAIVIPVDVGTEVGFRNVVWTLAVGNTIARGEDSNLDIFAGFRYVGARVRVDWMFAGPLGFLAASGSFTERRTLWDAIVGIRGKVGLGGKWYATYYFDIGGGKSDLTYQLVGGVAYRFKWGDVRAVYRHLHYAEGSGGLLHSLTLSGPAIGATLDF